MHDQKKTLDEIHPRIHLLLACLDCDRTTEGGIIKGEDGRFQLLCNEGCGHGFFDSLEDTLASLKEGADGHCRFVPTNLKYVLAPGFALDQL